MQVKVCDGTVPPKHVSEIWSMNSVNTRVDEERTMEH